MPNRIIKETICTSEEIDLLTDSEEVFFYRLMVNCDDFGLFDGREKIIASKCYPLKSIDIKSIQAMLGALARVGLISMYEVCGKPYLTITNWSKHQQIRAQRAKYPTPDQGVEIICNQLISDAPVIQSNPIQSESNPNPIQSSASRLVDVSEVFEFWKSTTGHDRAKIDDKRSKLIANALKTGYSTEDLKNAITGCTLSAYHMGDNDKGAKYDSLSLILRDAGKIDQFIGYFNTPPVKQQKPVYQTQRDVRDSAFLTAIGMGAQSRDEKLITGEVIS